MKFCEYNGAMHVTEIDELDGIIVPEEYEGVPVTDICTLKGSQIEQIKLPNSLKTLAAGTFYDCRFLKEIVIPEGIEEIPADCFNGCASLKSVKLPASVKKICERAFAGCVSLESIDLSNIEKVQDHAFSGVGLAEVSLTSVKVIEAEAFAYCKNLKKVKIVGDITNLPGMIFNKCISLESVSLPNSIKRIGMQCFGKCFELKEINKPAGLEYCSNSAFVLCDKLDSEEKDKFLVHKTSSLSFDFGGKR